MQRLVLVNTSPIQYLYQLGLIDLFESLYGKIRVPQEVVKEIHQGKIEGVDLPAIDNLNFVEVLKEKSPSSKRLVRDPGEGETAILLNGLENPGSLVVLDDFLAGKVATELELNLTGTAGILIAAKLQGLLHSVGPCLDRLRQLGFYLAPAHKHYILKRAGEIR